MEHVITIDMLPIYILFIMYSYTEYNNEKVQVSRKIFMLLA